MTDADADKSELRSWPLKLTVTELRRLLVLLSVEQLTSFREVLSRDYQAVFQVVTMTVILTDGLVSLNAITVLLDHKLNTWWWTNQLTLSLNLDVETKLKLNHSMTSLIEELHRVRHLHSRLSTDDVCNRLLLSFVYRKGLVTLTREFYLQVHGLK